MDTTFSHIKAVFCDIDGTLLTSQHTVSPRTVAAIRALRERGVVSAACAGFSLGEVAALTFAGAFDTRTGFELVCERAALADGGKLIFPKLAHGGVTVAFSKVTIELSFKER